MKRKVDELNGVSNRDKIAQLEAGLQEGQSSLNNIAHILDLASSTDVDTLEYSRLSLYKVFKKLISLGKLEKPTKGDVPTIVTWLRERYVEYIRLLLTSLEQKKANVQISGITLSLRLLKDDPLNPNPGQFPVEQYGRLISSVLNCETLHESTKYNFRQEYLEKFDDLRYYFYKFVEKTAIGSKQKHTTKKQTIVRDNILGIFSSLVQFPLKDEEISKFWVTTSPTSTKSGATTFNGHRKSFSDAWLAVLRFRLTEDQYKHILSIMHKRIIPNMPKPQQLMDFLIDSYDAGGSTSLLALNGLFYLMQNHGLDYPKFFDKLYALFDENTMHVRHRSRFFRLADLFLNSTHVSAGLIASFIKRMSRLSLTAPPAAIVIIIPLTYNLLKKHPSLMPMIHKIDGEQGTDPFDADERDPAKSRAIDSSLWEMASLTDHYHPNVATLARILGEQFTKPSYNLEDFLDHSYTTMTDAEMRKKLKNPVATAFDAPTCLFPESGIFV